MERICLFVGKRSLDMNWCARFIGAHRKRHQFVEEKE
jgi:hypothetical protein